MRCSNIATVDWRSGVEVARLVALEARRALLGAVIDEALVRNSASEVSPNCERKVPRG